MTRLAELSELLSWETCLHVAMPPGVRNLFKDGFRWVVRKLGMSCAYANRRQRSDLEMHISDLVLNYSACTILHVPWQQ